jgi:hypothetical protein
MGRPERQATEGFQGSLFGKWLLMPVFAFESVSIRVYPWLKSFATAWLRLKRA